MSFQQRPLRSKAEHSLQRHSFAEKAKGKRSALFFRFLSALKNRRMKRRQQRSQRSGGWSIKKWILSIFAVLFLGGTIWMTSFLYLVLEDLPDIDDLTKLTFVETTVIYDSQGNVLFEIHGDENREQVPIDEISENMKMAIVALEDDQFWEHGGYDIPAIIKAGCNYGSGKIGLENLFGLCPTRGGSTITQQAIKNLYLSSEQTLKRKASEIILAYQLEDRYGKEKILELYLNGIPFGKTFYGVETASRAFFRKSLPELSPEQQEELFALIDGIDKEWSLEEANLLDRLKKGEYESMSTEDKKASKILLYSLVEANLSSEQYIAYKNLLQKSVRDLTIAEAAILASIVQRPTYYSPFGERAFSRVVLSDEEIEANGYETFEDIDHLPGITWNPGLVGQNITLANGKTAYFPGRADGMALRRMYELGQISTEEYENAKEELLGFVFPSYSEDIIAPHYVFHVQSLIEERFQDYPEIIQGGGLRITTSLDLSLQNKAEAAIRAQAKANLESHGANNAALIAIDPKTGQVKALVGSKNYKGKEIDGEVNVVMRSRAPGSSFKPIAYLASFLEGKLAPESVLFDVKTNFGNGWTPQNFDGTFSGPVTIRHALGYSLNIPAVKAAIIASPKSVHETAAKLGIFLNEGPDHYGGNIGLGGVDASPYEMATAFATLSNGGKKVEPVFILKIEDRFGNIIYEYNAPEESEQVIPASAAYLMTDILQDYDARNPLWANSIALGNRPVASKTGTADKKIKPTDDPKPGDCWTVGYTPQFATAVWVGNTGGELMNRSASGASTAAPIWKNFMLAAHEGLPVESFQVPEGISKVQISELSGLLPKENYPEKLVTEGLFMKEFVPEEEDDSLAFVEVDRVSGKLPTEYTPTDSIEEKAVLSMHAYFPDWDHWEHPVQSWLSTESAKRQAFFDRLEVGEDVLFTMPTEYDDVHGPEAEARKPAVEIVSPAEGGTIVLPYITVVPKISARNGFQSISIYWNGQRYETEEVLQNSYSFRVIPTSQVTNTIRVEVTDELSYTTAVERTVVVGKDTAPPAILSISPSEGGSLGSGSIVTLRAEVVDNASAVKRVDFLVDGEEVGHHVRSPYETTWTTPNEPGEHTLTVRASDTSGNVGEESIAFTVEKSVNLNFFGIVEPKNNVSISCDRGTRVVLSTNNEIKDNFGSLEIILEDSNNRLNRKTLATFDAPSSSGMYEISFTPEECQQWIFYAKAYLSDGNERTTERVFVQFR